MRNIKTFETFDFSSTLPISSIDNLTNYYSCDDCDRIWREVNKTSDICKFCQSDEIEELSEDEWYEVVKSRSEEDELEWDEEREERSKGFVDLLNLKNKRTDVN